MSVPDDRADLLRQLAHEMQAPITSLELRLRSLTEQLPEDNLAASCLLELDSMKRLVTSFLELDAQVPEPAPTKLAPVLASVENRFRPIAAEAGVALSIEPVELTVMCDPHATERVLSNLVDNAIKFSSESGHVWVGARAANGNVEVEVRDRGIGIASEALARVFEPFYRVDREAPGSGLGLAISKRIADAQRGTLRCESVFGSGSSFILTLPTT